MNTACKWLHETVNQYQEVDNFGWDIINRRNRNEYNEYYWNHPQVCTIDKIIHCFERTLNDQMVISMIRQIHDYEGRLGCRLR